MTTKEVLTQARVLVEQGWTQKVCARNANGDRVATNDPDACMFCATGAVSAAIMKSAKNQDAKADEAFFGAVNLLDNITLKCDSGCAENFNDHPKTTKEDILELFDKAIARCQNDN